MSKLLTVYKSLYYNANGQKINLGTSTMTRHIQICDKNEERSIKKHLKIKKSVKLSNSDQNKLNKKVLDFVVSSGGSFSICEN